jgi:uncharacterized Zn-binding protein involved in type VI secretion
MPGIVRLGDLSAGHPHCYHARPNTEASPNVFCNGRGVHRLGDSWDVHGACSDHVPHEGVASSGSSSVYANGRPLCRIGDGISCGDTMAEGSDNVFAGG